MKKIIALFTGIAVFAVAISATIAQTNTQTISYLEGTDQSSPWTLMALRSAGRIPSASSINVNTSDALETAKTILAVTAANQDPSNFRGYNLISLLDSHRRNNQIGNPSLLNDDFWGIIAYYAAGISASDSRIQDAKNFIINNQASGGGWSYAPGQAVDSNDTAIALIALMRAGVSPADTAVQNGLNFLRNSQNNDGGFAINPGFESDGASTAWTISALQATGINPSSWQKNGNQPFTFLESLRAANGSYKWKAHEVTGQPAITSYAVIAINGTSYPVARSFASNPQPQNPQPQQPLPTNGTPVSVSFRFEGSLGQFCQGTTSAATPLDVIRQASSLCNFTYELQNTGMGVYVKRVGFDSASGVNGWLYLINNRQPSLGASQYQLRSGDDVTWYFGEFDWQPLRLISMNQTETSSGKRVQLRVEAYNGSNWYPVSQATILSDRIRINTNTNGEVAFDLGSGTHNLYATKLDYLRSPKLQIYVAGSASQPPTYQDTANRHVPLRADVSQPYYYNPPVYNQPPSAPAISFDLKVSGAEQDRIIFGNVAPGSSVTRDVYLRNTSTRRLDFSATVQGDQIFTDHILIDGYKWSSFWQPVFPGNSVDVSVELRVPKTYAGSGTKTGELIFWAKAAR